MKFFKSGLIIPEDYSSKLGLRETQVAIKKIKDLFEDGLEKRLNITRVSAPLFVKSETGLNDNLNGVERPVSFDALGIENANIEIVQSLAKWKRMALHRYGFEPGQGIYTDMNAIRRDENLDNFHSMYVDQWDWERVITKQERTMETLKGIVKAIYEVFKETEQYVISLYPNFDMILPEEISFITTQELCDMYPKLTPKERESAIVKERGAVFLMQIGGELESGEKHDGRSPDYDDWSLNGDIIFWYPVLETALEMSSMGIRVDEETLELQLKLSGCEDRKTREFHSMLLSGKLPYTIGGGIGQSRMCMFFLRKAHIGEVQAGLWPNDMIKSCKEANVFLL